MTKRIFKLSELLSIYQTFSVMKGFTSSEFNYFLNQNAFLAEDQLKAYLKEEARVQGILAAFNSERTIILEKCCNKNKVGEPMISKLPNGKLEYDLNGKEVEFKAEMDALTIKFKKDLDSYKKQYTECLKLLEKDCPNFKPYRIKKSLVPDNIPTEIYRVFFHLLE